MCAELPCTEIRLTRDLQLSDGPFIREGTVGMVRDIDLDEIKIEVEFESTGLRVAVLVPIHHLVQITSDPVDRVSRSVSVVQVPRSVSRRSGSGETEQ